MIWHKITFVSWCLIIGLVMLPFAATAATNDANADEVQRYADDVESGPEVMTIDLVLLRPLGLVATVCGSVIFLVSSPFSAIGGNSQEAWDKLVAEPAQYTFQRPLGHFEGDK